MLLQKFTSLKRNKRKGLAVLIDPDKADNISLRKRVELSQNQGVDFFFFGGSLVSGEDISESISIIRDHSDIPIVLFPGSVLQLNSEVDGILFLSLISGRNPEYLIGSHVIAAPYLKKMNVEVLSTGYMLIDGGLPTTASYISNSSPLPNNKPDIAVATALAGEFLGHQLIYMDAGSGADMPVSSELIKEVSKSIDIPLIVGGGISKETELLSAYDSGADVVVVGNSIERRESLILELTKVKNQFS